MKFVRIVAIGVCSTAILFSANIVVAQSVATTTDYTMGQFSFSYPNDWTLQSFDSGVSLRSSDGKHGVYVESFPAVTFESGFGCVSYRYDLLRGAWQWTDLGGMYPNCTSAASSLNLKAPTLDLGSVSALEIDNGDVRTLLIESLGQVLRLRAGVVKSTGAIDPQALAIFRTLRTTIR